MPKGWQVLPAGGPGRRGEESMVRLAAQSPVHTTHRLAEQGDHAKPTRLVGPQISRIGTSHKPRCCSWEVQGQSIVCITIL